MTPSNDRSLRWPNPNRASSSRENGPRVGMLTRLVGAVVVVVTLPSIGPRTDSWSSAVPPGPRREDGQDGPVGRNRQAEPVGAPHHRAVQRVQLHPAPGGEVVVQRRVRVRGQTRGEGHLLVDDLLTEGYALTSPELDDLVDDLAEHRPRGRALADVAEREPDRGG